MAPNMDRINLKGQPTPFFNFGKTDSTRPQWFKPFSPYQSSSQPTRKTTTVLHNRTTQMHGADQYAPN